MKIAVNKAHFPVTVLGPGRRIGIWLQGCSIGCKGCISQDTWGRTGDSLMTVAALLTWCRQVAADGFNGVTISGGEPFEQPAALAALLDALHHWRVAGKLDFDILCYSGYPLATLQKKHARLLVKLDALIPEPYIDARPPTHRWRGSANQPLVLLSARGHARYAEFTDATAGGENSKDKRIQLMVDGERLWYVGIPARGDMAALEASCKERGVALSSVSWRQ
jgi:anaerobic ribonucleoside-triphosphate reductase activating protein